MVLVPPPILLVEDDPNDVMLFMRALKKLRPDTDLRVAMDGDAAIEILSEVPSPPHGKGNPPPSHVIMDLKLPRRSGLEVIEWIRQRHGVDVRVVVLTSSQLSTDLERGQRAGVEHYYVKPPNFSQLLEIVRRILKDWSLLL